MSLRVLSFLLHLALVAALFLPAPALGQAAYMVSSEQGMVLFDFESNSALQVSSHHRITMADGAAVNDLVGLSRAPFNGDWVALVGFTEPKLYGFDETTLTLHGPPVVVNSSRLTGFSSSGAFGFSIRSDVTGNEERQMLVYVDISTGFALDVLDLSNHCETDFRGLTHATFLLGGRVALFCRDFRNGFPEGRILLVDPFSFEATEHPIEGLDQFIQFPYGLSYLQDTQRFVAVSILGADFLLSTISADSTNFTAEVVGSYTRETFYGTPFVGASLGIIPAERPCLPSATEMCLNGDEITGRFKVSATWEKPDGETGQAFADQRTEDSGQFWFFRDTNLELDIKVLDNCDGPTNRFWVFASGLTNLGATITVEDTATGVVKTYENTVGDPFAPILDTQAFDTCP